MEEKIFLPPAEGCISSSLPAGDARYVSSYGFVVLVGFGVLFGVFGFCVCFFPLGSVLMPSGLS